VRFAIKSQPRANAPDARQPTTARKSASSGTGKHTNLIAILQRNEDMEKPSKILSIKYKMIQG